MKDIKELLDQTIDLPDNLKEELSKAFRDAVQEAAGSPWKNIDVNKPLELLATDPDFKRLVTAWDRNNPEVTRAQLLRSFPAAFKDLQGNTIAEPLVDFLMDILHAIVSDTALMQRVIRQLDKDAREAGKGEGEMTPEVPATPVKEDFDGFKFLRVLVENADEYKQKEDYVLKAGYNFAFFANDELMPVPMEEATHKIFVKTVTVEDKDETEEGEAELSFVAKKMVALEWKPEYGGVGVEDQEKPEEGEEEPVEGAEGEEFEPETEADIPVEDEEFVDKVNEYLEYVAKEFIKENRIAIESGLKVELAEKLIHGMKALLTESNLKISENDNKVITDLEEKLKMNEETINSIYSKNIELFKENKALRKQIFEAKVQKVSDEVLSDSSLSESAKEKVKNLFKMVNYSGTETEDEIKNKLSEIKENFVSNKPATSLNEEVSVKKLFETDKVKLVDPQPTNEEKNPDTVIKEVLKSLF